MTAMAHQLDLFEGSTCLDPQSLLDRLNAASRRRVTLRLTDNRVSMAWIDFSRPHLSAALTAHLAEDAGGRGITTPRNGKRPPLFADTSDVDYRAMLEAIETGKRRMLANPRADMAGFRFAKKEP